MKLKKKRLGQYFSGKKVANLLINLCELKGEESIIDPMAGVGDMLTAAIQLGIPSKNICGIEIDPIAGNQCKKRIKPGIIYIGDAFSSEPYKTIGRVAWDLVITNPPYVRYQSLDRFESDDLILKNAKETRQSLLELVNLVNHLNDEEKTCFHKIIKHYSGLSDLAVPAWILCALLTRLGGKIAIVVPESWISRDYALSIKYMLLKFFEIEYIVEDLNSVWFEDALVKTNLLVARRVSYRENLSEIGNSEYKHIKLGASLMGENSLVENLAIGGLSGYEALKKYLDSKNEISNEDFVVRNIHLNLILSGMYNSLAFQKLLKKLEPHAKNVTATSIPRELYEIIGNDVALNNLVKIETWGFQVGQGLRTGANKFFYTNLVRSNGEIEYVIVDKIFNESVISVDQKYTLPAFRFQSDACDELVISKSMLSHRLLYIYEDIYDSEGNTISKKNVSLAAHIHTAEKIPIVVNGKQTLFPELSAVKPNIRKSEVLEGSIQRHWFMLPILTNRHRPQLCISRVNYKNVKCFLIADEGIVVDANFSTLWLETVDSKQIYAMLSLLNSTWAQSYLETISTVMGGGALKVEASHIRQLLLPYPTDELVKSLSQLGRSLAESNSSEKCEILRIIDNTILKSLINDCNYQEKYVALRNYLKLKTNARQRKLTKEESL
jgi:predicted RNA methylase